MSIDSVAGLVEVLGRYRLLRPAQLDELTRALRDRFPEPRVLARELLQRGWLTPFQVNQVFQGKAHELLLGTYILLERLGEGGMARVFKARQEKLDRLVAIKVIRKDRLASSDAVRRFQREIKMLGELRHPNMVMAYDADQVGETHYIAMEYVPGIDLGRRVKEQGPVPVADAVDYVRQTAQGLQHAHERGLVHRDIKPSNLVLTTDNGRPLIKILDLGLARLLDADGEDAASSLTRPGLVVGSPDFIAPEQARNAHKADIRSDLYSLGCTFYYLLAGQVPFPTGTLTEKLLQHYTTEPAAIDRLRPEVPPGVAAVVRKLMAKTPEHRFQTPAELIQTLAVVASDGGLPAAYLVSPASETANANIPLALPMNTPATAAQMLIPTPLPGATVEANWDAEVPAYRLRAEEEARRIRRVLIGVGAAAAFFLFLLMLLFLLFGRGHRSGGKRADRPRPAIATQVV